MPLAGGRSQPPPLAALSSASEWDSACSALGSPGPNQWPLEPGSFSSFQAVEASRSQGFLQGSEILDQILRWGSGTEVLGSYGHKCVGGCLVCLCILVCLCMGVCTCINVCTCVCICELCEGMFVHVDVGGGSGRHTRGGHSSRVRARPRSCSLGLGWGLCHDSY